MATEDEQAAAAPNVLGEHVLLTQRERGEVGATQVDDVVVEQILGGFRKAYVGLGTALPDRNHPQFHVVPAEMVSIHDALVVVQSPGDKQAGEGVSVAAGLDIVRNDAFAAGIEFQELLVLP